MLLCSNIVVIMLLLWLIMLHFYTKNASAISQRTYIIGVKTQIIRNIGTLHTFHFLQTLLVSVLSLHSRCHWHIHNMVLELYSRDTQLDHTLFGGKSRIILALCQCRDLKAADYAHNDAGIISASLFGIAN